MRKVHTNVRFEPGVHAALKTRAGELSVRSPVAVTVSDVVRIAVNYYLQTAPSDPGQAFGPDRWIRT